MEKAKKFTPLILVESYLVFTVLFFIGGPWDFKVINPIKLYGSLFLFQSLLAVGYYMGIKYIRVGKNISFNNEEKNIKIVQILMPIYFIILLIDITRSLGLLAISLKGIIDSLIYGINNPALSYYAKLDITQSNIFLGKLGTIIMFIGSPLSYLLLSLIILYYKKMNSRYKFFSIVLIGMYAIRYIATGTNKGVFDIIIIIISVIFLKGSIQTGNNIDVKKVKQKKSMKKYLSMFMLIIFGIMFFNYMIGSRSFGVNLSDETRIGDRVPLKENPTLLKVLPAPFVKPTILLSTYLTQGYYGLSLSMEVPVTPMLGAGSSMFLVDQVSTITDINQYTLQQKVQNRYGWDSRVQWFTMYSWIANDFGFIGVGFYMFLLGFFFSIIYKDALKNDNIIAKVLFALLMIQFFFIPANNQLMVNMNSFFSTIFTFILWGVSKTVRIKVR